MTFSFAPVALTFWLGLVAIACLHRIWRAPTSQLTTTNSRDRSTGSRQAYRDFSRSEPVAEGLIPILHRSLARVFHFLQHAVGATLSYSSKLISKMFRPQTALPLLGPQSTGPMPRTTDSDIPAKNSKLLAPEPSSEIVKDERRATGKPRARTRSAQRSSSQLSVRKRIRKPDLTAGRSSANRSEKKKTRIPKGNPMKANQSKQAKKSPQPSISPLTLKPSA
jgi:hypothetical protein